MTTYHGAYGNLGPIKTAYNSVMGRGDRVIANVTDPTLTVFLPDPGIATGTAVVR